MLSTLRLKAMNGITFFATCHAASVTECREHQHAQLPVAIVSNACSRCENEEDAWGMMYALYGPVALRAREGLGPLPCRVMCGRAVQLRAPAWARVSAPACARLRAPACAWLRAPARARARAC